MTEANRQKEIRLRKELALLRTENAMSENKLSKRRDFSVGLPKDTTHKPVPVTRDIPDVVTLPPKQKNRKENIPFWGD